MCKAQFLNPDLPRPQLTNTTYLRGPTLLLCQQEIYFHYIKPWQFYSLFGIAICLLESIQKIIP